MRNVILIICLITFVVGCTNMHAVSHSDLQEQVMATEKAFAKTMADRDVMAFNGFISDEAVFFSGEEALRGRENIVRQWTPLFTSKSVPFSWSPDHIEVLESGDLALSTGPVVAADGQLIARFNSIWRKESSGQWKIIFDKGCEVCLKCTQSK